MFRHDWYSIHLARRIGEKLTEKMISLPSEIAFRVCNLPAIERGLLYPRYEKFLVESQSHLPELSRDEEQILNALDQNGICVTSLAALGIPHSDLLVEAAKQITCEVENNKSQSSQTRHTITARTCHVIKHPAIFQWGLDHKLLRIVENYLRLPVAYDGYSYYFSVGNGAETGPRKWHRDKEDRRMVKIGVYLNDVDEQGGPFECLTPEVNQWVCDRATPLYKVFRHADMVKLLADYPNQEEPLYYSCLGQAGTVFFVDPSRYYHRGKPPTHRNRAALFFHYFSQRPKHPFFCERAPLTQKQRLNLTQDLSKKQLKALTWKQELPYWLRWVPKNFEKV